MHDYATVVSAPSAGGVSLVIMAVPLALGVVATVLASGAGLLAALLTYSLGGMAVLLALALWVGFRPAPSAVRRGRSPRRSVVRAFQHLRLIGRIEHG